MRLGNEWLSRVVIERLAIFRVSAAVQPGEDPVADWSETKIQDLVLFRNQSENSMTQLARAMSGG